MKKEDLSRTNSTSDCAVKYIIQLYADKLEFPEATPLPHKVQMFEEKLKNLCWEH